MFVFLIPRVPTSLRNNLREDLWELCYANLMNQTSKNWKAIVIGHLSDKIPDNHHFILLEKDDGTKIEKLKLGLNYIKNTLPQKPDYVIRLDDDDIFSKDILKTIDCKSTDFDCIYDPWHASVDLVYMKISFRNNYWLPNTVIHSYPNAIQICGPVNTELILQDHSQFWHIYYKNKNCYLTSKKKPVYYRVLSPYTITSSTSQNKDNVDWKTHNIYLDGYGPWISINKNAFFF